MKKFFGLVAIFFIAVLVSCSEEDPGTTVLKDDQEQIQAMVIEKDGSYYLMQNLEHEVGAAENEYTATDEYYIIKSDITSGTDYHAGSATAFFDDSAEFKSSSAMRLDLSSMPKIAKALQDISDGNFSYGTNAGALSYTEDGKKTVTTKPYAVIDLSGTTPSIGEGTIPIGGLQQSSISSTTLTKVTAEVSMTYAITGLAVASNDAGFMVGPGLDEIYNIKNEHIIVNDGE